MMYIFFDSMVQIDVQALIFALISCLYLGGIIYSIVRPWHKKRALKKKGVSSLLSLMERAGGRIEKVEAEEEVYYNYEYQDGYFRLTHEGEQGINLIFPAFFSTDREELEAVRNLVNRASQTYEGWNFFYSFNERTNEIVVSLATRLTLATGGNSDDVFRDTLRRCFALRQHFVATYFREEQEETDEREANNKRDKYLLRMREYISQPEKLNSSLAGCTIGAVLKAVGKQTTLRPLSLDIYGVQPDHIDNPDAVFDYDLSHALVATDEEGKATFAARHAQVVLRYEPLESFFDKESDPAQLTFLLEAGAQERDTLFFRVTLAQPAFSSTGNMAFVSESNHDFIQTLLLAYDGGSLSAKEAEVRYMWGDAKDKAAEGKYDDLSQPQRLLLMADEQPLGNSLYWARKHSLSGRYVEAIVLFEHAYHLLEKRFEQLSESERETFAEILYHLSFCYSSVGNYPMAYFYVSGLQTSKNPRYQQELVNTLVGRGDYRSLSHIDRLLQRLDRYAEREPEVQEEAGYNQHRSFLYRRRLQALINAQLWDDAESFATRLRSRDDCRQFAEEQLSKIAATKAALKLSDHTKQEDEDEMDEDDKLF